MTNIYRLALQVQDASNLNGVALSFVNEVLPAIRLEAGYLEQGTAYLNSHPTVLLFLDKMASLSGHWLEGDLAEAYADCRIKAEGLDAVAAAALRGEDGL